MKRKKNKSGKKGMGKKLTEMAGLAIKHEFYLEASWILSTIFERKLLKILDKLQEPQQKQGMSFSQLIKRVKYINVSSQHPDFSAHIKVGLIDDIRNWKNQRNEIYKDMAEVHVSKARLERLSIEGLRLFKELNNATKSLKLADHLSVKSEQE